MEAHAVLGEMGAGAGRVRARPGADCEPPAAVRRRRSRAALADVAAIAGNWCRLMDRALDNPERVEKLAGITPQVMAGIMGCAADALEAAGYSVEDEIDAAVDRIQDSHGMEWN